MNILKSTKIALSLGTLMSLGTTKTNDAALALKGALTVLGGVSSVGIPASFTYETIIPRIKKHFYKEADLLERLEKEVASNYFSGNEFIKEDYIEQNFKTVDHSFLNILPQDIQDILLPLLLEYEKSLDAFKKGSISEEYRKQLESDKYKIQRKLDQAIKNAKEKVQQPKQLEKWLPTVMGTAGLALFAAAMYNGYFTPIADAINSLSTISETTTYGLGNTHVRFNARIENKTIIPDPQGPFEIQGYLAGNGTVFWPKPSTPEQA